MTGTLLAMALLWNSPDSREVLGAQPLDDPGQVSALCSALSGRTEVAQSRDPVERAARSMTASQLRDQAVQGVYRAVVEPGAFRFRRYEPDAERLVIDTRWSLRTAAGWLELDVGRQEIALAAGMAQAEQAYRASRAGQTRLVLTFDLDEETRCGGMELIPPRPLSVRVLSVELVGASGARLLSGFDELAPSEQPAELGARAPSVSIAQVVVLSGRIDERALQGSLRGVELNQCYARALTAQPSLWGTVIFQTEVGRGGRPSALHVALDDLDEPDVVACLHQKLSGVKLAGVPSGARFLLPVELERSPSAAEIAAPSLPQ